MGALNIRGYSGKYVFIDLTSRKCEVRDFEEEVLKNFVGGPALGAKVLYDEMSAKTPWDAPESIIGFVPGAANGMGPLISARYTVVCKSPVTGMWNDANSGGNFGAILRKSGYDAVFVKGISENPVYIFIDNGNITFHDAAALWGKTIEDGENAIKEELGDSKVGIAMIGPAGERKSNMAAIMNDTHRAAGRGGPGAVMGNKNLKALVCRGDVKVDIHSRDDVVALNKEITEWCKSGPLSDTMVPIFYNYGTGGTYTGCVLSGDSSVRNWSGVPSELTEDQMNSCSSQEMDKRFRIKKFACNTCSIGCGAIYSVKDGKYPIKETGRPEYETDGMFGSGVGAGDPEVINWCNHLCNDYGFDTISFGGTIAWAMECYVKGLFTLEDTGGIDLKWGNTDAIVQMAEAMCKGTTEMGRVLNGGSVAAAKHYDRGYEYLMHAGGIETPQHDPRLSPGLSRTYRYDPTPGRHVKGGQGFTIAAGFPPEVKYNFDDPENAVRDIAGVIDAEITNMGGFCVFTDCSMPPNIKPRILTALTGVGYSEDDARKLGLRSYTMRHAFNLREGLKREDTSISDRLVGKPAMTDGPHTGITIDSEKLADHFFKALDWDLKTMIPSKAALEELGGLENVIADIYG